MVLPINQPDFLNDVIRNCVHNFGKADLIQWLIENGVDIHYGNEAFLRASIIRGSISQVKWLIEHGADIHVNNDEILNMIRNNSLPLKGDIYQQNNIKEYLESLVSKEKSTGTSSLTPTLIEVNINKLRNGNYTVSVLKSIVKQYNLKVSGNKAELIDRIMKHLHLS